MIGTRLGTLEPLGPGCSTTAGVSRVRVREAHLAALSSRLARLVPDAALAPLARLVRWAVSDPIVPVDSPHAYEYLIVANAV